MYNTTEPRNDPTSQFHGVNYLFLFPLILVLFIALSAVLGYYHRATRQLPVDPTAEAGVGLDETTLQSYPKLLYSQVKLGSKTNVSSCCSICLSDYKKSDMLRSLPDCGHVFHLNCVDPWLRLHPTCPICRKFPITMPRPSLSLDHHMV